VVDVTEMKNALEKLSRTEKQMKLFMDMSPLIKFMKDRQGRYVYVNTRHLESLGALSTDWIGRTNRDIFPPAVAEKLSEVDRKVFETGEFRASMETILLEDGQHDYLIYKFLVPNTSGGEDLLAGVAVDLTEQRRYERALRSANEKLSLLGSMTRHDIMNQLSVLVGWMDVVREGVTDPARLKRFGNMKEAAETIQELLVFASEYQDIGAQKPIWTPVGQAFEDGLVGLLLEGVRTEMDLEGLEVYADPMLERVFRNLVDNSLRHGEKVSRIAVSGREEGKNLVLTYEDDGVGIPEDVKERIFERGFGKHTGLGLFMVRQILGLTGITICETGRGGPGARFEMVVPEGGFRYSAGNG
jgi:PAS domain S-box-containing protein